MSGVHPASLQSLCLELTADGRVLGAATGFVVDAGSHPFLVTNWHVVAGRDTASGEHLWGRAPDAVRILHHRQGRPGDTVVVTEPLLDSYGQPLWAEHPVYGPRVDVVALALTQLSEVALHCRRLVDLDRGDVDGDVAVMTEVSVVGFPFGPRRPGEPAIWTRGTVASDPGLDYDDRPCFLVDARTRKGEAGSPVLVRNDGQAAGNGAALPGTSQPTGTRLVGVYSARVSEDLDLGFVWRTSAVVEVLVTAQSQLILQRFTS